LIDVIVKSKVRCGVYGTMDGQQLTPPQLLEAGHRAEGQGRRDLAAQFYHHLTEHFAFTPEAAEARNGLGRLGAAAHRLWPTANGAHANGAARAQRRPLSAPRNYYRMGHALAWLLTTSGWSAVGCGLGVPGAYLGLQKIALATMPDLPLLQVMTMAAGLTGLGLLLLLSGQIARAVFDQANALRELVAQERVRAWSE
jgi:hypothetical protein